MSVHVQRLHAIVGGEPERELVVENDIARAKQELPLTGRAVNAKVVAGFLGCLDNLLGLGKVARGTIVPLSNTCIRLRI